MGAAKAAKQDQRSCKLKQTIWDRTIVDPVAYYTLWLTLFTGALALVGVAQWGAIGRQLGLARDEFEASHRPWIAMRAAGVPQGGIHLDETNLAVRVDYRLENTSDVPALDLMMLGLIAVDQNPAHTAEIVRERVLTYVNFGKAGRPKPQNQIVFPGEVTTYPANFDLLWRLQDGSCELPRAQLSDFLIVAVFFYCSPSAPDAVHYTACVHAVTTTLNDGLIEAAKAGTGVSLNGKMDPWATGSTAV